MVASREAENARVEKGAKVETRTVVDMVVVRDKAWMQ